MQILDRHSAQPYRFCFSIISNQPYKKTVCSLNLPFYGSQPMLPVTPLILGCSSHFMKTPMPSTRIFCNLHALSHYSTFIIGQQVVVNEARFDAAVIGR